MTEEIEVNVIAGVVVLGDGRDPNVMILKIDTAAGEQAYFSLALTEVPKMLTYMAVAAGNLTAIADHTKAARPN
jgi:hypothetical protein